MNRAAVDALVKIARNETDLTVRRASSAGWDDWTTSGSELC
jgi:hypothetical protein